jgi:hypothetical protein
MRAGCLLRFFDLRAAPPIYQLNAHIPVYLYTNIFTTFLLHVSVCYTPSSGRATRIAAQNHMFFYKVTCVIGRPDSSMGIGTAYGLDGPGIESRWGARFSAPVQTGPEVHPASCTMGTGSSRG